MKLSKSRKDKKFKTITRILSGMVIGAGVGYIASYIAGPSGSQCMILCNQGVAVPYFAAMGLLLTWR